MRTGAYLPDDLRRRRLINTRQLAELLNFSPMHIRRLASEGKLPVPLRLGERKLLWRVADVEAFLDPTSSQQSPSGTLNKERG
jgi:excisionase family DNA binding protein